MNLIGVCKAVPWLRRLVTSACGICGGQRDSERICFILSTYIYQCHCH